MAQRFERQIYKNGVNTFGGSSEKHRVISRNAGISFFSSSDFFGTTYG